MTPKKKQYQAVPGERIIRLCKKSATAKSLLKHCHLDRIAEDYFLLWHEATTASEKDRIAREFSKEVRLALLLPLGIHTGIGFTIHFVMMSGSPFILAGLIFTLTMLLLKHLE